MFKLLWSNPETPTAESLWANYQPTSTHLELPTKKRQVLKQLQWHRRWWIRIASDEGEATEISATEATGVRSSGPWKRPWERRKSSVTIDQMRCNYLSFEIPWNTWYLPYPSVHDMYLKHPKTTRLKSKQQKEVISMTWPQPNLMQVDVPAPKSRSCRQWETGKGWSHWKISCHRPWK